MAWWMLAVACCALLAGCAEPRDALDIVAVAADSGPGPCTAEGVGAYCATLQLRIRNHGDGVPGSAFWWHIVGSDGLHEAYGVEASSWTGLIGRGAEASLTLRQSTDDPDWRMVSATNGWVTDNEYGDGPVTGKVESAGRRPGPCLLRDERPHEECYVFQVALQNHGDAFVQIASFRATGGGYSCRPEILGRTLSAWPSLPPHAAASFAVGCPISENSYEDRMGQAANLEMSTWSGRVWIGAVPRDT